jgi:integrase
MGDRLPRELITAEVEAIWSLADPLSRQLVALLLSGLTLEECAGLGPGHFDLEAALVRTPVGSGREVPLAGAVRDLLAACRPLPMWAGGGGRLGVDELAVRIGLLAHDAGLAQPREVTAEALRHTYVAYLVRQGARLTELERVIGPTAPSRLAAYMGLAPAGPAKSLRDLNLVYPLFQSQPSTAV